MILYNQNNEFIGMSSETLSYLGYEDLTDFTSQHSDFANLLVNKEGYIYKFENFSWLDFILYSGSPNKAGLLKLKNGEEVEIKISVKEVHLTHELEGNAKYYSVRILSDNFVTIASKTDASIVEKSPPKNNFNLNNLMSDTTAQTTPEPQTSFASANTQTEDIHEEEKSDFVLNFPTQEEIEHKEESFVLNLHEEESAPSIPAQENLANISADGGFKLQLSDDTHMENTDTVETPSQNSDFHLLKTTDDLASLEHTPQTVTEDETPSHTTNHGFQLKSHTEVAEERIVPQNDAPISLNFLKSTPTEVETVPETAIKIETPNTDSMINTFQKESIAVPEVANTEPTPQKREEIITQIQSDLEEIDAVETPVMTQQPQTASEQNLDAYLFNDENVDNEKKSFTKTLKSLFSESHDLPSATTQTKEDDDAFVSIFKEPDAKLKKNDEISTSTQKVVDESPSSLFSLGLDKEEENDLLQEFIHDTKTNIALFKDYKQNGKNNQADYALIKMQSSADILNLNAIITTLSDIKHSCQNEEVQKVSLLLENLEQEVDSLESRLIKESV